MRTYIGILFVTVFAAEMNPLPCRSGHDGDDLGNGNGFFGRGSPWSNADGKEYRQRHFSDD